MKLKDEIEKNAGYVDPMIPKVCRDPLPESKDALERLRDKIYEKLPKIGVDSRNYKLLEKRIEEINLILKQMSDKRDLRKMEIDEKNKAFSQRRNIRFYLNVLYDKIKQSILDQSPVSGVFEVEAKENHDILEQLLLRSDSLEFEEREKLSAFVRFFKVAPKMNKEAFHVYKTKLEDVMKVFPEEKPN